ncbi:MAG: chromosomal replication initiator DnaA [Paracoccaceae bacterium]
MAIQLGFDLPPKPAMGREDFLIAPSNAMAVALIDTWPKWETGKLLLTGPTGSGKTHLTHVWAQRACAQILQASDMTSANIPTLAEGPVAIEDIAQIAGQNDIETALFHLHNLVLANGHSLLLTGAGPLSSWDMKLPDLTSRLQAAAHAELSTPDDALLSAVLAKQFNDFQVVPKPDVIPYLVGHMDRSFATARDLARRLNHESLVRKKPITRPLAADVLRQLAQ